MADDIPDSLISCSPGLPSSNMPQDNMLIRKKLLWSLIIVVIPFMVYANSMHNKFLWGGADDEEIILRNQYLKDWKFLPMFFTENYKAGSGGISNFWRPFQLVVYSFIVHSCGIHAFPFHAASLLFHSLCGLLLYLFFLKLFPDKSISLLALAVLLWLVHPIHNSELAVTSGLASPAYLFWMLASLLAFWRFIEARKLAWHIAALACFVMAIFSKEAAIILPLLALGLHLALIRANMAEKSGLGAFSLAHIPFWILALVYVWVRLTVMNFSNTLNFYNQPNAFTEHLSYRVYTLFTVLAYGLKISFLPLALHPERSWPVFAAFLNLKVMVSFLIVSAVLLAAVIKFKKNPLFTFGVFWFLASFLPMSNVLAQINSLLWDHWFYVPVVGVLISLISLVNAAPARKCAFVVLACGIIYFSVLDWRYNRHFRDTEAVSRYILSFEPESAKTWNNLAIAMVHKGETALAVEYYKKAISLEDIYAQSHHNLANVYRDRGDFLLAEQEYKAALKIDPGFYYSYIGLGNLCLFKKDIRAAKEYFQKALEIYPYLPQIRKFVYGSSE